MCDEVGNMHKEFMPHMKGMVLSKKSIYTILVAAEPANFCGKPFLFEKSTNRLGIQMRVFGKHFLGNEKSQLVRQEKKSENVCCQ